MDSTKSAAAPAEPEKLTKVFVGNLSFKTTDEELANLFAGAGKVISANIISRGPRSLGYGFVEMDTEENAKKSVTLLHQKDVDGRAINVEVAKPRDQKAAKAPAAPAAAAAASSAAGGAAPADGARRGGRRGGARAAGGAAAPAAAGTPAAAAGGAAPAAGTAAPAGAASTDPNYIPRRRPRARGRKGKKPADGAATPATAAPATAADGAAPAAAAPKRVAAPKTPSTTTIFVANLPFTTTDEELSSVFKNLSVKSAHVVVKRNGRSKGFGFVEFNSTEDQQKAARDLNATTVGDRAITIKIALTEDIDRANAMKAAAAAAAGDQKVAAQ